MRQLPPLLFLEPLPALLFFKSNFSNYFFPPCNTTRANSAGLVKRRWKQVVFLLSGAPHLHFIVIHIKKVSLMGLKTHVETWPSSTLALAGGDQGGAT